MSSFDDRQRQRLGMARVRTDELHINSDNDVPTENGIAGDVSGNEMKGIY